MLKRSARFFATFAGSSDTAFYGALFWVLFVVFFCFNAAILAHYGLLAESLLAPSPYYLVLAIAGLCALLQRWATPWPATPLRTALTEGGSLGQAICFTLLFSGLTAIQMYFWIALFSPLPLHDAWLEQADRFFGFNWIDYLNWVKDSPFRRDLFYNAYYSPIWQAALLMLFAVYLRQQVILYRFILANFIALLIVYIVAGLFPAEGYITLTGNETNLLAQQHWPAGYAHIEYYRQLRAGGFVNVFKSGFVALITFPSYHTVLAVLLAWAFWSIPMLRWFAVLFNALVVATIPAIGGHYLTDCLAGGAVAAVVILLMNRLDAARQAVARQAAASS